LLALAATCLVHAPSRFKRRVSMPNTLQNLLAVCSWKVTAQEVSMRIPPLSLWGNRAIGLRQSGTSFLVFFDVFRCA
jgi:hypothetical protein